MSKTALRDISAARRTSIVTLKPPFRRLIDGDKSWAGNGLAAFGRQVAKADLIPNDRQCALTDGQLFDFEVIKRKYANMMDIMSFDDLLRRLDNIIASLVE